jgi:hypothetical protein
MLAKYILGVVGLIFLVLGGARVAGGPARRAQGRVWLVVGGIFAVVSVWLFMRTA